MSAPTFPERPKTPSRQRSEKQRLAEARRLEQKRRRREKFLRRLAGVALLILLIVGSVTGVVYALNSSWFDVTTVKVEGVSTLTDDDIRSLANVSSSSSLLLLSKESIASRLREEPWVADVSLTKQLPHTLVITVKERVPQAVVVLAGAQNEWLVSQDGVWLGKLDSERAATVPRSNAHKSVIYDASKLITIHDVPRTTPQEGQKVNTAEVTNALRILNGLSSSLLKITERVSAPSVPKTKIFTTSGIEISLGSASDIATKDKIVRSILKEQKGKVVLINVRSIDAPTWRGLSEN